MDLHVVQKYPRTQKISQIGRKLAILEFWLDFTPLWGGDPSKLKNTPGESNDSQKHARTQKISPLPKIGPETLKNWATGQHSSTPFGNI